MRAARVQDAIVRFRFQIISDLKFRVRIFEIGLDLKFVICKIEVI